MPELRTLPRRALLLIAGMLVMVSGAAAQGASFVPNVGQLLDDAGRQRPDLLYTAAARGLRLYLQRDRVSYVLERRNNDGDSITTYRIDLELIGARHDAVVEGLDTAEGHIRYYLPQTPNGALARPLRTIVYRNVYPHIDLRYIAADEGFKYELVVRPGGRVSDIRLRYVGADGVAIDDEGRVVAGSPLGPLTDARPVSHVEIDGQANRAVESRFALERGEVRFEVGAYDTTRPLVIDPTILWGTYYGSGGGEGTGMANTISVGSDGSVAYAGMTSSGVFPTSTGAMQTSFAGNVDACIMRFRRGGTFVWATYYGGTLGDYTYDMATDSSGNVLLSGYTSSNDLPVSLGAHQTTFGGSFDGYMLKVDSSGARLWATYYGGSSDELGTFLAIDSLGNPTLTASTKSSGLATTGAFRTTLTGTGINTVIAHFNAAGVRQWATYVGENAPNGIAVDPRGNIIVTGQTISAQNPVTTGAYQTSLSGIGDAWVGSFDSTGRQRWLTLLGGSHTGQSESGLGIAAGTDSSVTVVGYTWSTDFPTTLGVSQRTHGGGADAFVTRFSSAGVLQWSTYYGGGYEELLGTVTLGRGGNVVAGGINYNGGAPVSTSSITSGRGQMDGLLVHFDSVGVRLWSGYYSGTGSESTPSVAFDRDAVMVGMSTYSTDIPTTTGAHQTSLAGGDDFHLARICMIPTRIVASGRLDLCPGDSVTLRAPGPYPILWSNGSTASSITVGDSGRYWYRVTGPTCTTWSDTVRVTKVTAGLDIMELGAVTFCEGGSVRLDAGMHASYAWSTGETTRTITVTSSGQYRLEVVGLNGCLGYDTVNVVVHPLPRPVATATATRFCPGDSVTLELPTGYRSYWWSTGDISPRITVRDAGVYRYRVVDANGCTSPTDSIRLTQFARPTATIAPASPLLCNGDTLTLTASPGFVRYTWSTGETTPSIRVSAPGSYTLVAIDANGCRTEPVVARVRMHPAPALEIVAGGRTSICEGDSVLLYASKAFTSYRWSNGATSSFIHASRTGDYTLTVTDSNGCRASVTSTITVRPRPTPKIQINGPLSLCEGGETVLSINGYSQVIWSGGGIATVLRVRRSGRYWADVIDESGCRGRSDTVEVIVHEAPKATMTGPLEVCRQSEATYAGVDDPAYRYRWTLSGGDGTIVGPSDRVDVRVAWGSTGGTLTLVTEDVRSGCSGTVSREVVVGTSVRPAIVALPSTLLCPGGETTLDAGEGYASYRWSTGETTRRIVVRAPGRYAVAVATAGGCSGTSDSLEVRAATPPRPTITLDGPATICPGGSVRLSAGDFVEYRWSTGERTPTIDVRTGGAYSVTVRDANGCEGISPIVTIANGSAPSLGVTGPGGSCPGSTATYCASDATLVGYAWIVDGGTIVSGQGTPCVTVHWGSGAGGGVRVAARDAATGCTGESAPLPVDLDGGLVPPLRIASGTPCIGDTVELDAGEGFATYRWSTGETTRTIRVGSDGAYEVSVSDTAGCTGSTTIDLLFMPKPGVAITVGEGTCAEGRPLDAGPGHARYAWSTGDTTRTIRATIDGRYRVTVANAFGCEATATVDVSLPSAPRPTVSPAGAIRLCAGDSVRLEASGGYASYRWSTGETTRAIVVRAAGSYAVEVSDDAGCRGRSDSIVVTLDPPLDRAIARRGDTLVATPDAASYRWLVDGAEIAGARGPWLLPSRSGRYRVVLVSAAGCATSSEELTVVLRDAALSLDTVSAAVGDRFVVTLRADAFAPGPHNWSLLLRYDPRSLFVHDIGGLAAGVTASRPAIDALRLDAASASLDGVVARLELEGLATAVPVVPLEILSVRVDGDTVASHDGLVLLSGCLVAPGVAFGRAIAITSITPNPASSEIRVRFEAPAGATVALAMHGADGRRLAERAIVATGAEQEEIVEISELPSGQYYIKLSDRAERVRAAVRVVR